VPDEGVDALTKLVKDAAASRQPIYPIGGGTQQHRLADITEPGISISTSSITQLIDYPHEDMTITVQAGMTIANLQRELAKHHQSLPIDIPYPERATVGGSMAANISGPRKLGHGTWRDYVLGVSWINDQGQLAKAGGRVVKNVAGYDFCKLFCGSLGTLGIITQVTMKVKPLPEKRVIVQSTVEHTKGLSYTLQHLPIRPVAVCLHQSSSEKPQLAIMLEDNAAAVDWSIDQLLHSGITQNQTVISGTEADFHLQQMVNRQSPETGIVVKVQVLRSHCGEFLEAIQQQLSTMKHWMMQPLLGIFHGHLPADDPKSFQTLSVIKQLAHQHQGIVTFPQLPNSLRGDLQPWGEPQGDWALMQKVKHALDPHDLFQRNRHEILKAR
jgi:glycolate oxidase FAD binding subunit